MGFITQEKKVEQDAAAARKLHPLKQDLINHILDDLVEF